MATERDEPVEMPDFESDGFRAPCWCDPSPDCWHSWADLDESCGGSGVLHCYCGGDGCVCHNHGEVECDGCDDCEPFDSRDEDYDPEDCE